LAVPADLHHGICAAMSSSRTVLDATSNDAGTGSSALIRQPPVNQRNCSIARLIAIGSSGSYDNAIWPMRGFPEPPASSNIRPGLVQRQVPVGWPGEHEKEQVLTSPPAGASWAGCRRDARP
jgi:hypothetical protein